MADEFGMYTLILAHRSMYSIILVLYKVGVSKFHGQLFDDIHSVNVRLRLRSGSGPEWPNCYGGLTPP
eukprot:6198147-Pleurochrysis_carterae.AAC.1